MKKYLALGLFILALILSFGFFSFFSLKEIPESAIQSDNGNDSLKFSNTMHWDASLLEQAHDPTDYIKDWQKKISIQIPPPNSSVETQDEIKLLLSYKNLRDDIRVKEIIEQADTKQAKLGGRQIIEYFDTRKFPFTGQLLQESFYDLNIITLAQKERFDRVRPSALETKIAPVIDVPGHPAYPSGHSTQTHFLAYVLGELMPDKKQSFIEEADLISKNREIAGLHYPSDTQAGVSLASQFIDLVLLDPHFSQLIRSAKSEWR